jgi:hypothetical protein
MFVSNSFTSSFLLIIEMQVGSSEERQKPQRVLPIFTKISKRKNSKRREAAGDPALPASLVYGVRVV